MELDTRRIPIEEIGGTDTPGSLTRLQTERPVCPITTSQGEDAWLVTGHDEVLQVLNDPRFRRDPNLTGNTATKTPVPEHTAPQMRSLEMDGKAHSELRAIVAAPFSGRAVRRYEPRIAELATAAIENLRAVGPPADLVADFAAPFPVLVICDLLGVSLTREERVELRGWAEASVSLSKHSDRAMQEARMNLFGFFHKVTAVKRAEPGDDLLSTLATACYEAKTLSEAEMLRLAITVFIAGHETTVNAISLGAWRLLRYPDELARLRADPGLMDTAVEELLRLQFHPTVGVDRRRYAADDVELAGARICAGDTVVASINAANQDHRYFTEPDRFDITRSPNPHLSFGAGPHFCLGAALARAELRIAFTLLLQEFPGLYSSEPVKSVHRREGLLVAGLERLPVAW